MLLGCAPNIDHFRSVFGVCGGPNYPTPPVSVKETPISPHILATNHVITKKTAIGDFHPTGITPHGVANFGSTRCSTLSCAPRERPLIILGCAPGYGQLMIRANSQGACGGIHLSNPHEFIGFGPMDITNHNKLYDLVTSMGPNPIVLSGLNGPFLHRHWPGAL